MTAWAHLPNAAHIDRVLASVRSNPMQWSGSWDGALDAAWMSARGEAWNALIAQVRLAVWWDAREVLTDQVRLAQYAARDAVIVLIAYDDCAYMLDSDPGELAILAAFGDHRAVLLLPACKVFHSSKEIT